MRGWVPPDDRLWLHPSERGRQSASASPAAPAVPRPQARGPWVIGGLTVCVAVTLVIGGLVLAGTGDSPAPVVSSPPVSGVPTTEIDLSTLTDSRAMDTVAGTARDSTVALVVTTASGTRVGTGVVAEAGGIVVALEPVVAGARTITAVESDGTRQPAVFVGADPATRIAVLRIPDDLPVADFTAGDPGTGTVTVAMSEESRAGRPAIRLYAGTVLSAGIAVRAPAGGFCETAVAAPLTRDDVGSPLVGGGGSVVGILDAVDGTGRTRIALFLPAQLVRDVTAQLVSHGSVVHGALGATVVDLAAGDAADGQLGAVVSGVAPGGSAAQAGLERGDRIVAVDGEGVRSVAELDTRLYAEPPGTELPVTFARAGATRGTTVILGAG